MIRSRRRGRSLVASALALCAFAATASAEDPVSGAAVFAGHCAVCHGPEGGGIPGSFPSLHEQIIAFAKAAPGRDYLVMVVTTGLMGDLKVGGIAYRGVMPAQSMLSEADVAAVLSYLASDRGKMAGAPSWTAADVAAARARYPDKSPQNTRALRPTVSEP